MKPLLPILLIFLGSQCLAQQAMLSVSVADYQQFSVRQQVNDTDLSVHNTGIRFIPSIGYHKSIKGKFWIGCEFGFYPERSKNQADASVSNTQAGTSRLENKSNLFYLCPSISGRYDWKVYKIITELVLPLQYTTNNTTSYSQEQHYKATNEMYYQQTRSTKNPNEFNIGLFSSVGIQYRLTKGLYIGPQLGIGFTGTIVTGTISEDRWTNDNGSIEKETVNTVDKESDVRFDIQPSFSINYFF